MGKAQTCPVCLGKGKIYDAESFGKTYKDKYKTCHGCGGKGWVTVQD